MLTRPTFLYGTAWKEDRTERCVQEALKAGFRGIDTANQRRHYFEEGVGNALLKAFTDGSVQRSELFLQTKFTSRSGQDSRLPYEPHAPVEKQVAQSFSSSLKHLHTDYVDSYVLHGPSQAVGLSPEDWKVWHAMETIHGEGKAKSLGISNVDLDQLLELCEGAKIKPAFVQNRCYARKAWDRTVRAFCQKNSITYQGFSLLTANSEIFENPRFLEIQKKLDCHPAQLVFRFACQIGMLPLTGTTDPGHMALDLKSDAFDLSDSEIRSIETLSVH